jgi:hypothetical protein
MADVEYSGQPDPLPTWHPKWSQKFGDLLDDFNQHFYHEIVPEDEPEIVACFLMNYFAGDQELEDLIDHLNARLHTGNRY